MATATMDTGRTVSPRVAAPSPGSTGAATSTPGIRTQGPTPSTRPVGGRLSRKRSSVDGHGSAAYKHLNFSRIYIWKSDGDMDDITCDIIDTLQVPSLVSFNLTAPITLDRCAPCCFSTNEAKKPRQTLAKGHKNYDLILNLQLGISYSVEKAASTDMRELKPKDFDLMEKFWLRFPAEGSMVFRQFEAVVYRKLI